MLNTVKTTLSRDLSTLCSRRLFWWVLVLWALICALIFFAYLEDFLAIQPKLRAKNSQYGVTDIVIVPYLKTLSMFGLLVVVSLCSRLFYNEHFAPFARLYRSISPCVSSLLVAKVIYVASISFVIMFFLSLPVLVSRFFFDYHLWRVLVTIMAQGMLLSTFGLLAMLFSQIIKRSIWVVLAAVGIALFLELAARLLVEPTWLATIVAFFSPLTHANRIAVGILTLSDIVFFILLWVMFIWLTIRQFNNSYLTSS